MRIGSLFSGIGGLELGLEAAGLGETVWQVEQDEFCRSVLAKHWPQAERFDDVTTVGRNHLERVSLIAGGFPCQDISAAGKGAGLSGHRSGLWSHFHRIVEELRPEWVVVENVASGAKRWVDQVSGALGQSGYQTLPVPISAADVGAPHLRRRIFLIAHAEREPLRDISERMPWGREARVQREGEAEPVHDGTEGLAPDASGGRLPRGWVTEESWLKGQSGRLVDGCGRPWPSAPPSQGQSIERWTSISPVRCVDDGLSSAVVRDQLKALGNAVVPQCAEVVGHIIQELRRR